MKKFLPKGSVIVEDYKEPEIYEREQTPKQYIKQYELKIISSYPENQLLLNVYKYSPLRGGTYIELPYDFTNSSKGIINIIKKDDKCFILRTYIQQNHIKIEFQNIK